MKTQQFGTPKYVGDPLNAVRIFNEKEVDELVVFDIDATREGREPDYRLIESLAAECRMPLCYGGGVTTASQGQRIVQLGVEKVAVGTALFENPQLVPELATRIGSQSVVAVLDVRRDPATDAALVWIRNGTKNTLTDATTMAKRLESDGVGEIVLNSIDRDGTKTGYDVALVRSVREVTSVPLTALGGAGSLSDAVALIREHGIIGVAAGSLFVFKGQYRAVLINYPNPQEKAALLSRSVLGG